MKTQSSIKSLTIPMIILIIGLGIVAGCGDKRSESDKAEGDDMALSEEDTRSQQQRMSEGQTNTALNQGQTFEATLRGSNEVPEVDTDASGTVTVTLQDDSLHVRGQFSGLSSNYTASHIHKAAEGENGSPIQPLEPTVGSDKMSGTWDASYKLNEADIQALKSDSLYINVHSSEHQSGEIRGQLTSTGSDTSDTGM